MIRLLELNLRIVKIQANSPQLKIPRTIHLWIKRLKLMNRWRNRCLARRRRKSKEARSIRRLLRRRFQRRSQLRRVRWLHLWGWISRWRDRTTRQRRTRSLLWRRRRVDWREPLQKITIKPRPAPPSLIWWRQALLPSEHRVTKSLNLFSSKLAFLTN